MGGGGVGGAFSRDFTKDLSPQCREFSRALKTETSLQMTGALKYYKRSKHLKFRISNVQIICIYNAFIHVQ